MKTVKEKMLALYRELQSLKSKLQCKNCPDSNRSNQLDVAFVRYKEAVDAIEDLEETQKLAAMRPSRAASVVVKSLRKRIKFGPIYDLKERAESRKLINQQHDRIAAQHELLRQVAVRLMAIGNDGRRIAEANKNWEKQRVT